MRQDWQNYYELTQNRQPSPLLVKALAFVANKNLALDLGSGALKDSRYLINQGFVKVIGIDKESPSVELLQVLPKGRFDFVHKPFEGSLFPKKYFSLISAQYSLPFISPGKFPVAWHRLINFLTDEGVFVGQLFGLRDEWNVPNKGMTFHTRAQAQALVSDMEVLEFTEEEKDTKLASGKLKHWHIFNIIARKGKVAC